MDGREGSDGRQGMMRSIAAVAAVVAALASSGALAQLTLEDIEATAPAESERINELMSALENPDPNYRMHAFETILERGSDYERRLAFQRAFLGTDVNLRNAALRARLAEMPILRFAISRPRDTQPPATTFFAEKDSAWAEVGMIPDDLPAGRFKADGRDSYVIDDVLILPYVDNRLGICTGDAVRLARAGEHDLDPPRPLGQAEGAVAELRHGGE
jgi:hypothetical protein